MSGVPETIALTVVQTKSTFIDEHGDVRSYGGTAFWADVGLPRRKVLVTNRHNVDPDLRFGVSGVYRFTSITIRLRDWRNGKPTPFTTFHAVQNLNSILCHETADVALIVQPNFGLSVQALCIDQNAIANGYWLQSNVKMTDRVSFVGFPRLGRPAMEFWDTGNHLPLAREASVASLTSTGFTHPSIPTTHLMVVAGLSFGGASGSPVVVHEAMAHSDRAPSRATTGEGPRSSRIIGVMTGHIADGETQRSIEHSGLSYLTTSDAIHDLISRLQ